MGVHQGSLEELFRQLGTSHHGLDPAEAVARLQRDGPNRISERPPRPLLVRLGRHLVNPFALLLWVGAWLAFLAESFQPGEGMASIAHALVAVVLINAAFTFWQESRAEHAMAAFRRMLSPRARVMRGAEEIEIEAAAIVIGDILILREGDGVPADGRLFEVHALKVNNASLTGESEPQLRSLHSEAAQLLDARNLVFSGTLVSAGSGRAVVFATGDRSQLGQIAVQTLQTRAGSSPMQREIEHFIRVISTIAVSLGLLFFGLGWMLGNPFWSNLIFAIGIIVANVPEGLLPTVTLALSLAAVRMARRQALVKSLQSVETLGRTTVICTDKTGTLTSNTMRVDQCFLGLQDYASHQVPPAHLSQWLTAVSVLCNNAGLSRSGDQVRLTGDPTETALLLMAEELGTSCSWLRQEWPRLLELPFSSETRCMTTVHQHGADRVAYLKGAPEVILERCDQILLVEATSLEGDHRQRLIEQSRLYALSGRRVLALAYRRLEAGLDAEDEVGRSFTLVGLVALYDPPRPEVPAAVGDCRRAGIRVAVISGDHPLTVESVAREVGIVTTSERVLLTGAEMAELSDEQLVPLLRSPEVVLARTSPQDKLRVVELLQAAGEVVAVTGDGVNDAPALKRADIGVAMGMTGTEVAREAADVVLADDNFSTIVMAVREGRVIYGNIRKFIAYVLTSNIPEILPYIAFVLLAIPLPLTVVLILAIDLGTDMLPALGLAAETPEDDVMELPPIDPGQRLLSPRLLLLSYGVYGPVQAAAGFAAYFWLLHQGGWWWGQALRPSDPLYRQAIGAFFLAIVLSQVANVMACRTRRQSVFSKGILTNRLVLAGVGLELVMTGLVLYTPAGHALFGTAVVPTAAWLVPLPFAGLLLGLEETRKALRRHNNRWVERWLTW